MARSDSGSGPSVPRRKAPESRPPVVVVGAGMAGLCCALHLQARGIPVTVVEAGDTVGGRVRTRLVDGFRLDRGFQVLLTSYPEVREMLDLDALGLKHFVPGAKVFDGRRFRTLADPRRAPSSIFSTLGSRMVGPADALRVARLLRRIERGGEADGSGGRRLGTLERLRAEGLSRPLIERFFRPFLAGVFLDPALQTSETSLEFVLRMFANGLASLPAEGMGAIPAQLASRLEPGVVRLATPVTSVRPDRVLLTSGEQLFARAIVVATEARSTAKLLSGFEAPESCATTCLHFDAPSAPLRGPWLLLDGARSGPVNNVSVQSEVAPSYAPPGRSLVCASIVGRSAASDEVLERESRLQLEGWFAGQVGRWRLLRVDRVADAIPHQPPGEFEAAERSVQVADRLFVCGDHRDVASLQGAMASGRRAAAAVADRIG